MSSYVPVVVAGISVGSIYAIAAMGLTLTYKTSGVFNFAQGAIAAAAAYLFRSLHLKHGVAWPLAFLIVLVVFGVVAGFVLERIARGLADVPVAQRIVATIGLLVMVQGVLTLSFGSVPKQLPEYLGASVHNIGSAYFSTADAVKSGVALLAAIGLSLYFRRTRSGLALRGVVDDAALLDMTGLDPARVRRRAWVIGSAFAAVSGMLIAPLLNVDATLLTLLVVHAFGACAIGRFTSLPLTYVGGLAIGIAEQLVQKETASHAKLAQIYPATSFAVLLLVLILTPRGRLHEVGRLVRQRPPMASRLPVPVRATGAVVGIGLLAFAPFIVDRTRLSTATSALAQVALYLSLVVLIRMSGQVSLCQFALQGVGAALFGHAISHGGLGAFNLGLPWPFAVLVAGLLTVPLGLLVAIPAIRLSGTFLALATLGFGILLQQSVFGFSFLFGSDNAVNTPRPSDAQGPWAYYYVVLAAIALCAGVVKVVQNARLGRLLRAVGDSPLALSTLGTNVAVTRALSFALSAFLAGVSGALAGGVAQRSGAVSFQTLAGLVFVAILAICTALGGGGTVIPAFLAAGIFTFLPSYATDSNEDAGYVFQLAFGALAIAVALLSNGRWGTIWSRFAAASERRSDASPVQARMDASAVSRPATT